MMDVDFSLKWIALAGAIWIMLVDGGGYNFGLYSEAIKEALGYSQSNVSTMAFFRDIGANLGIYCGLLFDICGPRTVLIVGGVLNFLGYFFVWMIITRRISDPGVAVLSLLFFVLANSQAFGFTCAMITSVKNFPSNRGIVIGVVTGFVGLSGTILALVFQAMYDAQDTGNYLLFNAWFPTGVFILCLPLMKVVENAEQNEDTAVESKVFKSYSIFCFGLAAYTFTVILLKVLLNFHRIVQCIIAGILLLGILLTPCCILLATRRTVRDSRANVNERRVEVRVEDRAVTSAASHPKRGDNFSVLQALMSMDMWMIVVASSCGIGSVLAALDNMGQVGTAWRDSKHQITDSVGFTSIWNFLGRFTAGYVSEKLLQIYGTPRPLIFAAVLTTTACAHLFIALKPPAALLLASGFEGFALGAQLTLIFTMTSELFGLESFAKLYSIGTAVSTTVGTYLLSVLLAGHLYDQRARKQSSEVCYGVNCYRESFFIMVGVCMVGAAIACVLAVRTKHFYHSRKQAI